MALNLQRAKDFLAVDYNEDDALIQECLDSAIDRIEEYTNHSLKVKSLSYTSDGCDIQIYTYPIVDIIADDDFKRYNRADSVIISAPIGTDITVNVGVSNKKQLEMAVLQLTAYYYENREPSSWELPNTIQGSVNQLRRGLF